MKYHYPINSLDMFINPLAILPKQHTMGNSLIKYMEMKIPDKIIGGSFNKVIIKPCFDRSIGISKNEKNDKLFNYMRPTSYITKNTAYVNCFPGIDYVFHYGNILKTYLYLNNNNSNIEIVLPSEEDCFNALERSGIYRIPKVDTVILGNVEYLQSLSESKIWEGDSNFLWKRIGDNKDALLLGCKHTYWGEISARLIMTLADLGVKKVIYSGKLGGINAEFVPNKLIATGNTSILPNGSKICWDNMFENIKDSVIREGTHITVPSVLQETKKWIRDYAYQYEFVDPEIGHMANAAINSNIKFSYLHIISDNLLVKYTEDLSNERKETVINNRRYLYKSIVNSIDNII